MPATILTLKHKLAANQVTLGSWITLAHPGIAIMQGDPLLPKYAATAA